MASLLDCSTAKAAEPTCKVIVTVDEWPVAVESTGLKWTLMLEVSGQYELQYNVRFVDALGDGKDGRVLKTAGGQAVKFFYNDAVYRRELRAYQILLRRGIDEINGFQIPLLIRWDDVLLAIEMTIVGVPFLLDFASAYTKDEYGRFAFSQEVLEEREIFWADIFGDDWPAVQLTCEIFKHATGLILLDLSLNNIRLRKN